MGGQFANQDNVIRHRYIQPHRNSIPWVTVSAMLKDGLMEELRLLVLVGAEEIIEKSWPC